MSEPFIGEIRMVGFDFPPKGWALCDGSMLNAQQHSSLFSLLGNAFGGDQTNFALPDMQSRFPIGAGQGDELTSYFRGEKGGVENAPLHNMGSSAIGNTGAGHSHENMPPFLAVYFIIALQGKFPSRN